MNDNAFKPIEEPKSTEQNNVINQNPQDNQNEEKIIELPTWNIEPPVEINRGQNDIR